MEGQLEVGRKGKRGMGMANTTIHGKRSRNGKVKKQSGSGSPNVYEVESYIHSFFHHWANTH